MFGMTPYERKNGMADFHPFSDWDELEKHFFGVKPMNAFGTDIKDTGNTFELATDLPGFKKEDIKITSENGYLTISAERKEENKEENDGTYLRRERSYGSFSRSFDLSDVDEEHITASFEDGVLKLTLPKKEPIQPAAREISIN